MRIISGKYKGRHIRVKKNFKARPTTDFAKENLFNVLSNYFDFNDIIALDLFAGTGSISLELASRGCLSVDMVESDYSSFGFVKKVIAELGIKEIRPIHSDVFKFISVCSKTYDMIFADPPYALARLAELPDLIMKSDLLKQDGWFILEHPGKYNFEDHPYFRELRRYGSVHFSIFTMNT